jgi:hypothetical protein
VLPCSIYSRIELVISVQEIHLDINYRILIFRLLFLGAVNWFLSGPQSPYWHRTLRMTTRPLEGPNPNRTAQTPLAGFERKIAVFE